MLKFVVSRYGKGFSYDIVQKSMKWNMNKKIGRLSKFETFEGKDIWHEGLGSAITKFENLKYLEASTFWDMDCFHIEKSYGNGYDSETEEPRTFKKPGSFYSVMSREVYMTKNNDVVPLMNIIYRN